MKSKARAAAWSSLGVVAAVTTILQLNSWRIRSYENERTCGGEVVDGKVAYGANETLELESVESFSSSGSSCMQLGQVHRFASATDTAGFYLERRNLCPDANDADPQNGIDTATLFFYAGHGLPNTWATQGEPPSSASTGCMLIGNPEEREKGGGRLRYYLKCSCQVFAHGPATQALGFPDYTTPGDFEFGYNEKNVLKTWGQALGSDFRLACGSSTRLTCDSRDLERLWLNKKAGLDVADSFIAGLHSKRRYVPVCLSRGSMGGGGEDPRLSALYDSVFTAKPNPFVGNIIYLEYIRPFDRVGFIFPSFVLSKMKLPEFESSKDFLDSAGEAVTGVVELFGNKDKSPVGGENLSYYSNRNIPREPLAAECPKDPRCGEDKFFFRKAGEFLVNVGWNEEDIVWPPAGARLLIDAYDMDKNERVSRFQKGVIVRVARGRFVFLSGGQKKTEFDGEILLNMNNNGEVIAGWKRWRKVEGTGEVAVVKSTADARGEALALLGPGADNDYNLSEPRLVYRLINSELVPMFLVDAESLRAADLTRPLSRRLEIPARVGD
jgi:hypothetical protein